jgi:hypothetical protein
MTELKKGPWYGGPDLTPEEEAEILKEIYPQKNKIKKQIEETGYYHLEDDDNIGEVLRTLFETSKEKT